MHPNPRKIIPLVILLVAVAGGVWWYLSGGRAEAGAGKLAASGSIEATQVQIAPELGGRVAEVLVQEGEAVKAGQELVRFDDALLQAQRKQAETSLALAQANYDLVAKGMAEEQRQAAITAAELELKTAQQALDDLNEKNDLAKARAGRAVAAANKAVDDASERVDNLGTHAGQADIDAAHASMILAKDRLDKARDDFEPFKNKADDNTVRAMLQSRLAAAQKAYDATVTRYNNTTGLANELDLNLAKADLAVAQAQQADSQREYDKVKDGPDPKALDLAQARLEAAKARLLAAKAGPSPEQLKVAQDQVEVAQSALGVIKAQLDKLVLKSPVEGVVMTRSVEPGEVAAAGSPLLTLASLGELTLTIYVPEDRYGEITLGQDVQVSVDSFPGERFKASVVHISDQAEFTPRNVQTSEGRRTTVFAVKLSVQNPQGKLKPGMPADVEF